MEDGKITAKKERVKIKLNSGRIFTLTIHSQDAVTIVGRDKFGSHAIIAIKDIEYMFPIKEEF